MVHVVRKPAFAVRKTAKSQTNNASAHSDLRICFSLSGKLSAMHAVARQPGPEVIKLFSCPTQVSIKFQLLIKTEMLKKIGISCFSALI